MPFDLPASTLWPVPYSVGGAATIYVGSQIISFADFPSPPSHQLCCLIFNVSGNVIVQNPPRRVEIPSAVGGTGLSYSIGTVLFRLGQNVAGRRPIGFSRLILSSNQDLFADTMFARNVRGLISAQIEVSPSLAWSMIILFFP